MAFARVVFLTSGHQRVAQQNTKQLTPVFDQEHPIGATGQMRTWYTTKPCFPAIKSHISHLVGDSSWEGYAANIFDTSNHVVAYAKNDHLGFIIYYMWQGSRRRYVPDFIVKLSNGTLLVLEIKGSDSPQNQAKRDVLDKWVMAVNEHGGFGRWAWDVVFEPGGLQDCMIRHSSRAHCCGRGSCCAPGGHCAPDGSPWRGRPGPGAGNPLVSSSAPRGVDPGTGAYTAPW